MLLRVFESTLKKSKVCLKTVPFATIPDLSSEEGGPQDAVFVQVPGLSCRFTLDLLCVM